MSVSSTVASMFSTTGAGDQILTVVLIILLLLVLAAVFFLFKIAKDYKHKIRIKEVISGRKIIFDDKAKDVIIDGITFWKLMKKKDVISVPPPDAIEISSKGKKCVECYKTETGEYIFSKDIADIKDVPEEISAMEDIPEEISAMEEGKGKEERVFNWAIKEQEARDKRVEKWKKENRIIDSFQPFTTKQRLVLVNQLKKAEEKRKKDWKDMIPTIVSIGALLILVVSLMIFYADMGKPLLDMAGKQIEYEQIKLQQLEVLNQIKNDIQVIKDDQAGGAKNAPS